MDQTKWLKHIEAYKASNLSKAAYARKHDLDYYQFIYWSGKIEKAQADLIPVKINSIVDNSSEAREPTAKVSLRPHCAT